MLTKIIDLGCEVQDTGEPRARLVEPKLLKTASTEIQDFWDAMEPDDSASFLWVIGVSAREFYGCNNNGDAFDEADLKKTHSRFVDTAHVFMQHVNKDPAKSIGKPVFSWYNDVMHRVELILKINKNAPGALSIVSRIRGGDPLFVSMGCTVDYDVCSICGHQSKTRKEYCDHLRYNLKKILEDGRQVYALNPNPKFFDISIVARPADPMAFTLDKRASMDKYAAYSGRTRTSAELGEKSQDYAIKLAGLKKVSDIVKRVDGQIVDSKDSTIEALNQIKQNGFENLEYPEMPYEQLENLGVTPAGFACCLSSLGAPMTLGDAAWMGSQQYPCSFGSIFDRLPIALKFLRRKPSLIDSLLGSIFSSYNGECDHPVHREIIIRIIRPVAQVRIRIVNSLSTPSELIKTGAQFGQPDPSPEANFGLTDRERLANLMRQHKANFVPITIKDKYGNEAVTTPYYLRQAMIQSVNPRDNPALKVALLAALSTAALGVVISQPTLLRKAIALAASGVPIAVIADMMNQKSSHNLGVTTSEGGTLSDALAETTYKFEKKATTKLSCVESNSLNNATIAGMSVPQIFALDYAWNRWHSSL